MTADDGDDGDLEWGAAGPRSRRYGDVYFSAQDGLAESRAVFLEGCGLPDAWRGRSRFVVGELGFGTGLNILALLQLWRLTREPGARLHVFSVEAHPITADEARRALGSWPELAVEAEGLAAVWPGRRRGFHRLDLPAWGAVIDLAVMEASAALGAWSGAADAWFLDGFSPARNPEMWSEAVLAGVAARSAPGARLATFTVAGAVRRGLQAAGFTVSKRPGHGRKKERLEAWLPGSSPSPQAPGPRVAVVGGGIAGAALVRALRLVGADSLLIAPRSLGDGASGNPAALVSPRLDAGLGPEARLAAQCFDRAVDLYAREAPEAVIARGAVQLAIRPKDVDRFALIAASDVFAPDAVQPVGAETVAAALDEPAAGPGLQTAGALVIEPALLLSRWTADTARTDATLAHLVREDDAWLLLDGAGGEIARADAVCLACGLEAARLADLTPLRPVRGQVNWVDGVDAGPATAWGGYAVPTRDGVLYGASHIRGDSGTELRPGETAENLARLAQGRPALAARLMGAARAPSGRAAVRATTADHLPLAGAVAGKPGLFILAGLGGRGFTTAPLLAEHVAALVVGAPSPLPQEAALRLSPSRLGTAKT